jgi:hypothetical protein
MLIFAILTNNCLMLSKYFFLVNGLFLFIISMILYLSPNPSWLFSNIDTESQVYIKLVSLGYGVLGIISLITFLHSPEGKFKMYLFLSMIAFNLLVALNYYAYLNKGIVNNSILFYSHLTIFIFGIYLYLTNIGKTNLK